jgi:hypothetical protein
MLNDIQNSYTQHEVIQNNDTQHMNKKPTTLFTMTLDVECCNVEFRIFVIVLNVVVFIFVTYPSRYLVSESCKKNFDNPLGLAL